MGIMAGKPQRKKESRNVTRHTCVCSQHFERGLGPTKANPVPSIFDFPKHLQPKEVKQHPGSGVQTREECFDMYHKQASKSGYGKSKIRKSLDFNIVKPQKII